MNIKPTGKSRFRIAVSRRARAASVGLLLTDFFRAIAWAEPTGQDILKASQKAYDALISYSDKSTSEGDAMGKHNEASYTTLLLRPNLYKIEWTGSSPSGLIKGVCRSDSTASLLTIGSANSPEAMQPMRSPDLKSSLAALIMGAGVPIATDVPGIFLRQENMLASLVSPNPQVKTTISVQADEIIGQTDCFVISVVTDEKAPPGRTRDLQTTSRLSIGKQDFLIRRWRTDTGFQGMNIAWTITHQDVSVNPHLSPEDFAH